jgi:magnesium-transporting ATPase (P-type)
MEEWMATLASQSTTSPADAAPNRAGDLEKASVDQVLAALDVQPNKGLSSAEAEKRLAKYGPNAIVERQINAALEFWQDHKASNALTALKKGLAPESTALRDGNWQTIQAQTLVPGDVVKVRLEVIVPADLRFPGGDHAAIDQAALTGESLPVEKTVGDEACSGSVVKQGEMRGVVIATGADTFFSRTAKLVASAGAVSHAQKAMFQIGNFLIVVAVALALILVSVKVHHDIIVTDDWGLQDALGILQFVLVLLVASHIIPASEVFPKDMDPNHVPPGIAHAIERADGFARVFREHKYPIVRALQARGHLVAMTGDGVNDAPALKQADCDTAVSGATDAARGAAALVLTAPGLSVINNAIDEARRILFGWVWLYDIVWMCVLGGIRLLAERFAAYRTVRQANSRYVLNQPLRHHATS